MFTSSRKTFLSLHAHTPHTRSCSKQSFHHWKMVIWRCRFERKINLETKTSIWTSKSFPYMKIYWPMHHYTSSPVARSSGFSEGLKKYPWLSSHSSFRNSVYIALGYGHVIYYSPQRNTVWETLVSKVPSSKDHIWETVLSCLTNWSSERCVDPLASQIPQATWSCSQNSKPDP